MYNHAFLHFDRLTHILHSLRSLAAKFSSDLFKDKPWCVGRVNGELKLHCHDAATWRFPSFSGNVACRGLDFHFWDAVDDLSCTDMDLVFDRQRLYMHNASGMFGSVPLTLSGESSCTHGGAVRALQVQIRFC